jgi:mannose-6-phosphate isomerase-like protein (cupin superfamily)
MQTFELADLIERHHASKGPWLEFLRTESLSMGIYELEAGAADPQQPHGEDEVYFVLEGQAHIEIDGEHRPVQPGSVLFVGAKVPHRFHSIVDSLRVLVFFAPAEGSNTS